MANQWDGIIELSTENTIVPAAFNVRDGNVTGLVGPDAQIVLRIVMPSGDTTGEKDTAAIQAAHDSLPSTGGEILIAPGIFYLSDEVLIDKPVYLHGAGGGLIGDAGTADPLAPTTIKCLSPTANGFNSSSAGCTFRDFALINVAPSTPTAGAGILCAPNNTATIDSITVLGFWNNLDLGGVYYTVTNSKLYDAVNYYLYHHSPGSIYDDHGDFAVIGNVFSGWKYGRAAVSQFRWESGGGIKLIGNKFNSGGQPGNLSAGVSARCIELLIADGKTTGSVVVTGNSISGWASNTGNVYIGQLGPTKNGAITSINITGNEFAVSAQGITIEGNSTYDDKIKGINISDNIFSFISGSSIKARYVRRLKIGVNTHNSAGSPLIDIPDLVSNCVEMSIAPQRYGGEVTSKDIIRDNRSIGNTVYSLAGGVEYDYTHGLSISTNGVWTQVFKIEVPNQAAGTFVLDIAGRSTDTPNTSANRKGVTIKQQRAYDVNASGTVTITTIGTDVAEGAGSPYVSVRYTVSTNWIAVEVQTTNATNCVLWGQARMRVDGKLQTFHVGT